jgi:hypothetical protein
MSENDNMRLFLNDTEDDGDFNKEFNLSNILDDLDNFELQNNDTSTSILTSLSVYYELNYNVKQLLLICDYYKIGKELRINKSNKTDIIHSLVLFEDNTNNFEIVLKRKQLWFYISELKNDKFMKKYVLWT